MTNVPTPPHDANIHRFWLDDWPAQPWLNGTGVTRELLVGPNVSMSEPESWDWRISVADNVQEAEFSLIPEVDRDALLFDGIAMALVDGTSNVPLHNFRTKGAICHFAGEIRLRSQLLQGSVRLLNVMTRRGRAFSAVGWLQGQCERGLTVHEKCGVVLLAASGYWRVCLQLADGRLSHSVVTLATGEGLILRGLKGRVHLLSQKQDAALAHALVQPCTV